MPEKCVTELQGQYSVFVVEEGNVVKSRQVKLGEALGDLRLITEGLEENEIVVIDGFKKSHRGWSFRQLLQSSKVKLLIIK